MQPLATTNLSPPLNHVAGKKSTYLKCQQAENLWFYGHNNTIYTRVKSAKLSFVRYINVNYNIYTILRMFYTNR